MTIPCCGSLQLGGMVVCILEIIGSITSAIFYCYGLVAVVFFDWINLADYEDHPKYKKLKTVKSTTLPALYTIFGIESGCSLLKTIFSFILLWGILDCAVGMMRIWLKMKIATTIISLGLNVTAYVATYIKRGLIIFQSCYIVAGLYFMWVIWALSEEINGTRNNRNKVRPGPAYIIPETWREKFSARKKWSVRVKDSEVGNNEAWKNEKV